MIQPLLKKFKGTVSDIIVLLGALFYLLYSEKSFGLWSIVGITFIVLSIIFWLTARYQLGEAFSITPKANSLVRHGIYKKIRHPIYLFSTIAALGVCIMYNTWWMYILFGLLIILQIIRARLEEKTLAQKFGQEYIDYKKSTWF